jgi:acyl transferase domain-containing protein
LLRRVHSLQDFLQRHPGVDLKDLAYTLNTDASEDTARLVVMSGTAADLQERLTKAAERLADPSRTQIKDSAGIYYFDRPLYKEGSLALLFPGEGAQYLNMMADLVPHFPEVKERLEEAETFAEDTSPEALEAFRHVFRLPAEATKQQRADAEKTLRQLHTAIFSVMLADGAMFRLLSQLGLKPAAVAGHSMGEVSALQAAGCIAQGEGILTQVGSLLTVLLSREAMGEMAAGVLLAVAAGRSAVEQAISDTTGTGAYLAMDNCPHQSVVVGLPDVMGKIEAELQARRLICERLPFDRPYHTPLFEPYLGPVRELYEKIAFHPARIPIYSFSTGLPFSDDPNEIRQQAVLNYAAPVEFTRLIKNMYANGVRLFVECGPRGNLTSFTEDILRGERFATIASNLPHRSGITQLSHLTAQLAAHHVPLNLEHFYSRRDPRRLEWEESHDAASHIADATDWTPEDASGSTDENDGAGEAVTLAPAEIVLPEADGPAAAAYSLDSDDSLSVISAPSARGEVVMKYFAVMEQFLDDQSEVMNAYLGRTNPAYAEADLAVVVEGLADAEEADEDVPRLDRLPMLRTATLTRFEAGKEILLQRRLDLAEDRFASHHTVGGQAVSKIDPDQHGLPVMPMTFSLEFMAEAASLLVPNHVAFCVKNVRLFRWLAFEEAEPTSIEISARLLTDAAPDSGAAFQVQVEIRELVGAADGPNSRSPAPCRRVSADQRTSGACGVGCSISKPFSRAAFSRRVGWRAQRRRGHRKHRRRAAAPPIAPVRP